MNTNEPKKKLPGIHVADTEWLEEAKWRRDNKAWLDISFAIAVKIMSVLKLKGISQKDFAERMGCSAQYVNKLLKGSENLQLETICKIEGILEIKLIEIPLNQKMPAKAPKPAAIENPPIFASDELDYSAFELAIKQQICFDFSDSNYNYVA